MSDIEEAADKKNETADSQLTDEQKGDFDVTEAEITTNLQSTDDKSLIELSNNTEITTIQPELTDDVLSAVYNDNGLEIVVQTENVKSKDVVKLPEKISEITEDNEIIKKQSKEDEQETKKTYRPKENPLAKLIDPTPPTKLNLNKKQSNSTQNLSKNRTQNLSTESLQPSRIPRGQGHLNRSVSMYTPRVSNPVPAKVEKTPVIKKPVQKIPHLIHAQRRPGSVLKRSMSMSMPRKRATEMAEGMTLVLAVPVDHTTQSVYRSSGEGRQPFIISPYQEEHVLAATCPVSGITRHIKIIL